jgi:phenylalanyl-tRNA synthetase beta chain
MKVSLRWLTEHLTLNCPVEEMLERLTMGGTEVESVDHRGLSDPHVVVAEVLSFEPHPNADRLRLCQVSTGTEKRQIVCGAKNFEVGSRVALALPGAKLPGGLVIKESKLRGELSQGMMCSAKELAMAEDGEGLWIMPAETPLGSKIAEMFSGDIVFEIEVTPNRPDLLSYAGLAREIAALGCGALIPRPLPEITWPSLPSSWSVTLADEEGCPFYTASYLTNVRVGPSPVWLQEKIRATGHQPINNVVDITNYILWETGQPLHAFDAALLEGSQIQVRRAQAGETLLALDDATYALTPETLIIADGHRPQAIAGVMGGKLSGVTTSTSTLILESAWFNPAVVRRQARALGLSTDSSYRFERRVDPAGVQAARDRALHLLQELSGATLAFAPLEKGARPANRGPIRLRPTRCQQVLGLTLTEEAIAAMLHRLGLVQVGEEWLPPSFRYDLEGEIDLIEELARLHGLANFPSRLHLGWSKESATDQVYQRTQQVRHALAARGWQECLTEAFVEEKLLQEMPALALRNPLTAQYTHLRPSLQPTLLQTTAHHLAQGNGPGKLFELGRCYSEKGGRAAESLRLGLVVVGPARPLHWAEEERGADLYDLTGTRDFLLHTLGVRVQDQLSCGAVPPAALKLHGIKGKVFFAEFELTHWAAQEAPPRRYTPWPSFPGTRRDLALVVPRQLPQQQVLSVIHSAQIAELERVELFDVFTDESGIKIAADQKSLAYALTYRAADRTLTEQEVAIWQTKLVAKLKAELGCELRTG